MSIVALLSVAPALAQSFSVEGTCPDLTVSGAGFTPSGWVAVLHAHGEGAMTIPRGSCAGAIMGLDATARLLGAARMTPTGSFFGRITAERACGQAVQLLDVATCTLSEAVWFAPPASDTGAPADTGAPDTGASAG